MKPDDYARWQRMIRKAMPKPSAKEAHEQARKAIEAAKKYSLAP